MTQSFNSFFLGGFECSTQRGKDGRRLDLLRNTRHDELAAQDYRLLRQLGIDAVRDGVRWHRVEATAGRYDWSSFLPMLHAAHAEGMQVIWDLCHYGYPDHIDIWSAEFPDAFARFAAALATIVRNEQQETPFYCPINEISFWAWAGGDMALFNPGTTRRGMELKRQLVRGSLAAMRAIREVDPRARFVQIDPVIHVVTRTPRNRAAAAHARRAQFEAWDMLAGTLCPELGGGPDFLDIIGVNYYSDNQWFLRGPTLKTTHPLYKPFRQILAETWARYRRPLFVAETGAEGDARVPWLRYVCDEVAAAREAGVPVGGICLYPVADYPGWSDNRHCPCGLIGLPGPVGRRSVHEATARELSTQRLRFADASDASGDALSYQSRSA